jgi:cytidyltransferase-like protein
MELISPRTVDVSHDIEETLESAIFPAPKLIEPKNINELNAYRYVIGVGCTASLVTDRQKIGEHRVFIAVQSLQRTIQFSLRLHKDARTRLEEERLVADLILNAIETVRQDIESHSNLVQPHTLSSSETSCPAFVDTLSGDCQPCERIPLPLKSGEVVQGKQVVGSPLLVDLFFGKLDAVLWTDNGIRHFIEDQEMDKDTDEASSSFNPCAEFTQAIFPGSFSPIHQGHLEMINIAEERLQGKIVLEISVQNVDKPPFDYIELEHRLRQIKAVKPDQAVWLTRTPLFVHKAELFHETTFIVGADTLKRFADLRFYQENIHRLHDILRTIALYECRFLVFARQAKSGLESLETLEIPDMLRSLCDDVPPSVFTMNISSSELRQNEVP